MSRSSDSSKPRSTTGATDAPAPEPPLEDVCATCRKRRRSCPKYPRDERGADGSGKQPPHYTLGEEIANSITHGIGCLLAIAGLVLLIVKAALGGAEPTHLISAIVCGVTLIFEYLASTLYHSMNPASKHKAVFHILGKSSCFQKTFFLHHHRLG